MTKKLTKNMRLSKTLKLIMYIRYNDPKSLNLKTSICPDLKEIMISIRKSGSSTKEKNERLKRQINHLFSMYQQIQGYNFTRKQIKLVGYLTTECLKKHSKITFKNFKINNNFIESNYPWIRKEKSIPQKNDSDQIILKKQSEANEKLIADSHKPHPIYGNHPIPTNQEEIETFYWLQRMEKNHNID